MRRSAPLLALVAIVGCSDQTPAPPPAPPPTQVPGAAQTDAADAHAAPRVDPWSGLVVAEGHDTVASFCQACHSLKLVVQNRADAEGWDSLLRWMTEKQHMAPIPPESRSKIVSYLAANYGPSTDDVAPRRDAIPAELLPPTAAELLQGNKQ